MRYPFLSIMVFLMVVGCKPDQTVKAIEIDQSQVNGKWDVVFVSRNGKETKTTENAYFEFEADNLIKSNLFGDEKPHTFTFDKGHLSINDAVLLQNIEITKSSADSLVLRSKIKSFAMEFVLTKAAK